MNKQINFSNLGGFPLTQDALQFMQESYTQSLASLAKLVGDKVIIWGMVENAGIISEGAISYNGEIIPFIQSPVQAKLVVDIVPADATFEDDTIQTVYSTKIATTAATGGFDYSELKRLDTNIAIQERLAAHLQAYLLHTHSWNNITERPAGFITHVNSAFIGNIGSSSGARDNNVVISIPDQGVGQNYIVAGALRGVQSDLFLDNDVSFVVGRLTPTSFTISLREYEAVTQDLRFDYAIIKSL